MDVYKGEPQREKKTGLLQKVSVVQSFCFSTTHPCVATEQRFLTSLIANQRARISLPSNASFKVVVFAAQ